MELSLHGSQICLATRQPPTKQSSSAVNYPILVRRPNSAQLGRNQLPLNQRLHHHFSKERPQSADTSNYFTELKKSNLKSSQLKRPASSSNILKLLLAEPIKQRYWSTSFDSTANNNDQHSNKLRTHMRQTSNQDDSSECESVEEEIEEDCEEENNEENDKIVQKKITTKPPLPKKPLKLGFSMNNNVTNNLASSLKNVKHDEGQWKYAGWFDEKSTAQKKLDLPGRVSFSTNDVVVGDYSDDEDHNYHGLKKSVHFSEELKGVINYPKSGDTIIEEYKREIQNLNRKREAEIKVINNTETKLEDIVQPNRDVIKEFYNTVQTIQSPPPRSPIDTVDFSSSSQWNNSIPPLQPYPSLVESSSQIIKNYLSIKDENITYPKEDNRTLEKEDNETTSYVIEEIQKTPTEDKACCTQDDNPPESPTEEESSVRIEKPRNKVKNSPLMKRKKVQQKCENRKPKSAVVTPSCKQKNLPCPQSNRNVKNLLRKSKSISCLRENTNLNEFQIEKIESWMSMHDNESFSEKEHRHYHHQHHIHLHRECQETPSSASKATDDEGNFSLEDQIDTNSSTESTYDEIVEIIKEIDMDKRKSHDFKANIKENVEMKFRALLNSDSTDSAVSEESDSNKDKLKVMLTYLDDIDKKCDKTLDDVKKFLPPNSARSEIEFAVEPDIIEDVPKIADLVMFPNHQLARRIVSLSLRANELSNAVLLSKEHVAHVRSEKQKLIRSEKQNGEKKLKEQKKHYEDIVQRHQGFIEQLLKDKSELCDKVTALTRRIDSQNLAWEHKITTEVQRARETVLAGEKIRREKWVRDNTKRIKELTVKGLELEINSMTSNHQKDIADLRAQHQQEMLTAIEEVRQKYEIIEKNVRDTYAKDREGCIEKERNAIRERFEKQMEIEQKSFEVQKEKMLADFEVEKSRLMMEMREKEDIYENTKENLLRERTEMIEQVKCDSNEKHRLQEIKHQGELKSIQEQFESDFAIWKREHEAIYKRREVEREDAIRQQCRLERDRQIDSIVAKVDAEQIKSSQEYEVKIIRLREKYENEMRELEINEKQSRDRFSEARHKLAESEASIQNQQATIKQLEIELGHTKKMCDDFIKEKENFKENAKTEKKLELKQMQKDRDSEIERIYSRVQQAMEKKDSALELLQNDNTALKERCFKLEAVIRQQRKDYCIK